MAVISANLRVLTCVGDALIADRIAHIAAYFVYPLPVYLKEDLLVFGSADTFAEALALYRAHVLKRGIVRLRPRIVANGLPLRGSASTWVEWDHLAADGTCLGTNQVRYVFSKTAMDLYPRVEMVDYTVTAFPEFSNALPTQRTA